MSRTNGVWAETRVEEPTATAGGGNCGSAPGPVVNFPCKQSSRFIDTAMRRIAILEEENYATLTAIGEDRTNIIRDITEAVFECGVSVDGSFCNHLGPYSCCFFLLRAENPRDLRELIARLGGTEYERAIPRFVPRDGKKIIPDEFFDLTVEGPDKVGMLFKVCETFARKNINILSLETRREPCLPEDFHPEKPFEAKFRTSLKFRLAFPRDQRSREGDLVDDLHKVDPDWQMTLKRCEPAPSRPSFDTLSRLN